MEASWDRLKQDKSIIENTLPNSGIIKEIYRTCFGSSDNCAITEDKIENIIEMIEDFDASEVSLALVRLSSGVDDEFFDRLKHTLIKNAKQEISKLILESHMGSNSDILFLLDNPHHRPEHVVSNNFKLSQ